jgi:hypothetical protein
MSPGIQWMYEHVKTVKQLGPTPKMKLCINCDMAQYPHTAGMGALPTSSCKCFQTDSKCSLRVLQRRVAVFDRAHDHVDSVDQDSS